MEYKVRYLSTFSSHKSNSVPNVKQKDQRFSHSDKQRRANRECVISCEATQ